MSSAAENAQLKPNSLSFYKFTATAKFYAISFYKYQSIMATIKIPLCVPRVDNP